MTMAGVSWKIWSRGAQAFLRAQSTVGIIVGGRAVVAPGVGGRGINACFFGPVWCLSQGAAVTRIWDWTGAARGHGEVDSLDGRVTGRWDSSRKICIQERIQRHASSI